MKRKIATALLAGALLSLTLPASAHRYDEGQYDHPLRIIGHLGNAVGVGLEYLIVRPIHWIVSRDNLDVVFGHEAQIANDGTYFEWTMGDYKPSIAELREARSKEGRKLAK